MNHRSKPVSRLTIVFILAVLFSGSILTWFSINNISNLKELTEKRIIEEQRELSSRFSSAVQRNIEKVTTGLNKEINLFDVLKDSVKRIAAGNIFIIQPFILKNTGQLLYPNFTGIPENISEQRFSAGFRSAFRKGEEAEFADRNLIKAKNNYLSCLNYGTGAIDSAKALNALGRVAVKQNKNEDALNYYTLIISDFFAATDENGNPYTYYALPQLLKITNEKNAKKILPVVEFCLGKIETGFIPLNYNTEELVILVTGWLKTISAVNAEKSATINKLATSIIQQVRFTIKYGNELSELLRKDNPGNYITAGNDFKVVNSVAGTKNEFILINTNYKNPAGFLFDRTKLFDEILRTELQSGLEFSYKIDFPAIYRAKPTNDNLIYSPQLSPWFPDQQIEISLINKDLIKNLVNRRGLIYGIASLFLLVAMCLGVALILRDITRERNLARLRTDFISNVTHELKTPLTSIRMYAESLLMERVKTNDTRKEYLEVVLNESERLKRMINNILEFSKTEKGRTEYHFVKSNLTSIIRSAIHEMSYWFEKENFEVVTELDENIDAEVDPEKIKQVVENLLSNSIKYSTDVRQVFIRLQKAGDNVLIEVEDKGIGIPADRISHIFEPFYRIEQKESISGTGLGLTVVKEIVDAHKGIVEVNSEPGKGSIFTVRLPVS